jgi:hypothetical protein
MADLGSPERLVRLERGVVESRLFQVFRKPPGKSLHAAERHIR